MGSITTVPMTTNSRIRGYHYLSGEWKAVAVDLSGELAIHAEISDIVQARISGQQVRMDGYDVDNDLWIPIHVDQSGEIKVEAVAEISGGVVWVSSGDINVYSGIISANVSGSVQISGAVQVSGDVQVSGVVVVTSGAVAITSGEMDVVATSGLIDVHAVSGAVAITSGEMDVVVTSGAVAIVSGEMDVVVTSGAVAITSGEMDVVATSGLIDVHAVSGAVAITSGEMDVVVTSGAVAITSGEMDVVVTSGAVAIASGELDAVVTSGAVIAYTSGQQAVLLGEDYVQASGCVASGAVEVIKTVTAIQAVVVSGEDLTPETRLMTGADNKHIRFHDIFDGNELMDQKWDLVQGTAAVTDKFCALEDGTVDTIMQTHDMFLYGVMSARIYSEDIDHATLRFGFVGEYAISTKDAIVEYYNGQFHTENAAQTMGDTYTTILGLADDTWYDIQIVWTPEYAQLWIDGELRATHTDNVPQAPARLYFNTPDNNYLNIDHVSLTAYGDIPITNQGRVPVREQGNRLIAYQTLLLESTSGGMVLGSGQVDRVIIKVPLIQFSGQGPLHTASGHFNGIWIGGASGEAPYCGSGFVASGKGLYLEPGEQKELYVGDLSEVYAVAEVSGDPISYIAEAGTRT